MTSKQLITTKGLNTMVDKAKIMKEINQEIQSDYQTKIKNIVKQKVKEIKMTEILLAKQKKELDEILSGKIMVTEEMLLFQDD